MNARIARAIFLFSCFAIPLAAIIFVTRGDLTQASNRLGRMLRGDDAENVAIVIVMLVLLISVIMMWLRMRRFIQATATGEYCGHVLSVPPGEEAQRALNFMRDRGVEGTLFEKYNILNRGLYARPEDETYQPFLVTGFLLRESGALFLLGHCAALAKPQPPVQAPYSLVLHGKFEPEENDITADQVAGHTAPLYAHLSEELGDFVNETERLRKLILMGTQMGHWLLSGDYPLQEMRTALGGQDIKKNVFDLLMLLVLENLQRTRFNPAGRQAVKEFIGQVHFPDRDLDRRKEKILRN